MPYVEDENGDHIFDDNGKKIEYQVTHKTFVYTHKEPIHVNDDGHLDTENRHLVIKDGVDDDHAITKSQLDNMKTQIENIISSSITAAINQLKCETSA